MLRLQSWASRCLLFEEDRSGQGGAVLRLLPVRRAAGEKQTNRRRSAAEAAYYTLVLRPVLRLVATANNQ